MGSSLSGLQTPEVVPLVWRMSPVFFSPENNCHSVMIHCRNFPGHKNVIIMWCNLLYTEINKKNMSGPMAGHLPVLSPWFNGNVFFSALLSEKV